MHHHARRRIEGDDTHDCLGDFCPLVRAGALAGP
jgi:hypothetical protein